MRPGRQGWLEAVSRGSGAACSGFVEGRRRS
jgi:hypothetical protein